MDIDYSSISSYGVLLKRLTEDKLELVRHWRNDPKISQYMEYREFISSEDQLKWFKKVDNNSNYYYLIVVDEKEIGVINVRDLDYINKAGEFGIFIWDDNYLNSDYSFRATLCLYDFCFDSLGLESLHCHILNDNKRSIQYNKFFGYKLLPDQTDVKNQKYSMTKEDYLKNKNKIIKYL